MNFSFCRNYLNGLLKEELKVILNKNHSTISRIVYNKTPTLRFQAHLQLSLSTFEPKAAKEPSIPALPVDETED
jgi:hypothetical protein